MAERKPKPNLRRRGASWCVVFRVHGRQVWKSFADCDFGGEKGAFDAADLWLHQAKADKRRGQFRPPAHTRWSTGRRSARGGGSGSSSSRSSRLGIGRRGGSC